MTAITRTALDAGFRGGIDVRVSLRAGAGDGNSAFDGALVPAHPRPRRRGARADRRARPARRPGRAVHLRPRRLVARGAQARSSATGSCAPAASAAWTRGVVCLTWDGGARRADLLVVPPETDVLTGARALRLCTRRGLPRSPQMVLAAARSTPLPQVPALPGRRAG